MSITPSNQEATEVAQDKLPASSPQDSSLDDKLSSESEKSQRKTDLDSDDVYDDELDHIGRRGVQRVQAVTRIINTHGTFTLFGRQWHSLRILILFFLFLQGYCTGLDGNMSMTMQQALITIFSHNGDAAAVNTVKSVIASAVFIPYARLSDRFGRMELWVVLLVPFLVGRITTAAAPNFAGLFAGVVIEELGYAGFRFLSGVIPSDITTLKDHTFSINIYELPEIINLWAGSHISQSLIGKSPAEYAQNETEVRWGFGIFTIVVPFTTALLAGAYFYPQFIAYRRKELPSVDLVESGKSFGRSLYDLLKEIDLVGVVLYTAGLVLLLLALSLGGGKENEWSSAHIIVMIAVGFALVVIWVFWEVFFAPAPILPKRYFGITFVSGVLLEFFTRTSLSTLLGQASTNLLIGYNQTTEHAQWLGGMVLFVGAVTNAVMGIILHYWPRPRFFLLVGGWIYLLGIGLFVKYRADYFGGGIHGYIGAIVITGLGAAMMRYPLWTLVQASVPHKDMASAIGLLMSAYQVGASVGSCLASAIWQNTIQSGLMKNIGPMGNVTYMDPMAHKKVTVPGKKLAQLIFVNPNRFTKSFPMGSPVRDAILRGYEHGNWVTAVVAVAIAALVTVLVFVPFPYDVSTKNETISEEKRKDEERKFSDGRKPYYLRFIGF